MRTYIFFNIRRKRCLFDPGAHLGAAPRECRYIGWIEPLDALRNALAQSAGEEGFMGCGRGGETAGHPHPGGREPADHFAQRGVLAADLRQVRHAEVF
jgi:hypothetical protein